MEAPAGWLPAGLKMEIAKLLKKVVHMPATSAPAPIPGMTASPSLYVHTSRKRRASGAAQLTRDQLDALADLALIARNVRFDMTRPPTSDGQSRFTEEYLQELGARVLEVVDSNFRMPAPEWDAIIDQISKLVAKSQ